MPLQFTSHQPHMPAFPLKRCSTSLSGPDLHMDISEKRRQETPSSKGRQYVGSRGDATASRYIKKARYGRWHPIKTHETCFVWAVCISASSRNTELATWVSISNFQFEMSLWGSSSSILTHTSSISSHWTFVYQTHLSDWTVPSGCQRRQWPSPDRSS